MMFDQSVAMAGRAQYMATGSGALAGTPYSGMLQAEFNMLGPWQKERALGYLMEHNRIPLMEQLLSCSGMTGGCGSPTPGLGGW
jgi:hypothetical protein